MVGIEVRNPSNEVILSTIDMCWSIITAFTLLKDVNVNFTVSGTEYFSQFKVVKQPLYDIPDSEVVYDSLVTVVPSTGYITVQASTSGVSSNIIVLGR